MSSISTPYYKALDFTIIFLSCAFAYWVRFNTFSLPLYYFLPTCILALVSTFSLTIVNFYDHNNSTLSTKKLASALSGLSFSVVLTIACLYLTKTSEDYSRIWLVSSVCFALLGITIFRVLLNTVFNHSIGTRLIILLGEGRTSQMIIKKFSALPDKTISICTQFKINSTKEIGDVDPFLETTQYIENQRKDNHVKSTFTEVWVTHDIFSKFNHTIIENAFSDNSVKIVYIPELPDSNFLSDCDIERVWGIPTINSDFSKQQKLNQLFKFIEDQVIGWISIILLFPIMLLIAVAIKFESRGPAIFQQIRYGFGGSHFTIWKFRTMYSDETSKEFKQATKNDPRITNVGRFLRKTSLDELPQLMNIINGTMSIVGPRPHPVELNEEHRKTIDLYMKRHNVKPGITGLAQINGFRGETSEKGSMQKRIDYDLAYVNNWNVILDIKIIILTVLHLFKTDNAY